jgi:hypothetical protein
MIVGGIPFFSYNACLSIIFSPAITLSTGFLLQLLSVNTEGFFELGFYEAGPFDISP